MPAFDNPYGSAQGTKQRRKRQGKTVARAKYDAEELVGMSEEKRRKKMMGNGKLNTVPEGNAQKVQKAILDVRPERLVLRKSAGTDLIGGRPQAQFTGYLSVPGQVPGQTTPLSQRPRLDPEADRALNAKPPPWNMDRYLDNAAMTAQDVVSGLGLSKAMESRLSKVVARAVLSSGNRVELAKSIMQLMLHEGLDGDRRQIINHRTNQLYQRVLQKSGFREVFRPDDLMELKKAQHVKYVAKIERGGGKKPIYHYDEKKYREKHGTHVSGEEGSKRLIQKNVVRCVSKAGDGGCAVDGFKEMVQKYGPKDVHSAVKAAVDAGELEYKKGRFMAKKKKEKANA